jgi:hypothetical protein
VRRLREVGGRLVAPRLARMLCIAARKLVRLHAYTYRRQPAPFGAAPREH